LSDPHFKLGDQARVISARHRIGMVSGEAERRQGQFWYPVFFGAGQAEMMPEEDLELYTGASDIPTMLADGVFGGREALSRLVTQLKLLLDLRSQIYSLFASRTRFYGYQFKPLLKFLESANQRLLIADEVGLGKTIEAGLILTELRHRRPDLKRVLIVPPAHLRNQWQAEMRQRFDYRFRVLDSRGVREFLADYERERGETELWGIVSLQTLRGAQLAERWEEVGPHIDLIVFDEAGRLRNPKRRSHGVARLVTETADGVLLLTATPVQTGAEDLYNLLRLLDPESFARADVFDEQLRANRHVLAAVSMLRSADVPVAEVLECLREVESSSVARRFHDNPLYTELVGRLGAFGSPDRRERIELQRDVESLSLFGHLLSRTRKRDVHEEWPERRARVWRAEPTLAEGHFYDEVTRICREAYLRADDRRGVSFGIIQPQRQMASCMVAMVQYIEDRLAEIEAQELEAIDIDTDDDDNGGEKPRARPNWEELGNLDEWRRKLQGDDSKFKGLVELLESLDRDEPGAKVIIFTFFKRTVWYLQRRLAEHGIEALDLTGDTPPNTENPELDERLRTINRFRDDPRYRVMIATEVADEGLNLQFAHCMVNYDLPWNPMRIEQRIGRVDRIGQDSDVIQIVNLSMADTIEDRILVQLFERIGIFRESIGDLESILGELMDDLQHDLFSGRLTPDEEARRISQTADVIERRAQESERLQDESKALIGQDEFFLDEIERARRNRRYLSGGELLLYLRDFLAEKHRACTLKALDDREGVYRLRITEALRNEINDALPPSDAAAVRFRTLSADGMVLLTTESGLAERDATLDLLNFYHPLIRAVNRHYDEHATELHPVSHVRLESADIRAGTYLWLLYATEITGVRPIRDLELVALDVDCGHAVDADTCEALLWRMVAEGQSVPENQRLGGIDKELIAGAENDLVARLNANFEGRRKANEALVANRLASLRETYERTRRIREESIQKARWNQRNESYIKGLETRLSNLEADYNRKVADINAAREMSRSYQLKGGGIVEVCDAG